MHSTVAFVAAKRSLEHPLIYLTAADYKALGLASELPLSMDEGPAAAGRAADEALCRLLPRRRREPFQTTVAALASAFGVGSQLGGALTARTVAAVFAPGMFSTCIPQPQIEMRGGVQAQDAVAHSQALGNWQKLASSTNWVAERRPYNEVLWVEALLQHYGEEAAAAASADGGTQLSPGSPATPKVGSTAQAASLPQRTLAGTPQPVQNAGQASPAGMRLLVAEPEPEPEPEAEPPKLEPEVKNSLVRRVSQLEAQLTAAHRAKAAESNKVIMLEELLSAAVCPLFHSSMFLSALHVIAIPSHQCAAESASGCVRLCLTQAEERDVFKAAHEMLTERVRVSDNERVRLSAQLEEKEESENLLRNEFERMRVSVEEMVTQKSHQFGRAQASTALPGSSSCSRFGLDAFRLSGICAILGLCLL